MKKLFMLLPLFLIVSVPLSAQEMGMRIVHRMSDLNYTTTPTTDLSYTTTPRADYGSMAMGHLNKAMNAQSEANKTGNPKQIISAQNRAIAEVKRAMALMQSNVRAWQRSRR